MKITCIAETKQKFLSCCGMRGRNTPHDLAKTRKQQQGIIIIGRVMKTKRNNLLARGEQSQSGARERNETGPSRPSHIPAMISYNRHTHSRVWCRFWCRSATCFRTGQRTRLAAVDTVITFLIADGQRRRTETRTSSDACVIVQHI